MGEPWERRRRAQHLAREAVQARGRRREVDRPSESVSAAARCVASTAPAPAAAARVERSCGGEDAPVAVQHRAGQPAPVQRLAHGERAVRRPGCPASRRPACRPATPPRASRAARGRSPGPRRTPPPRARTPPRCRGPRPNERPRAHSACSAGRAPPRPCAWSPPRARSRSAARRTWRRTAGRLRGSGPVHCANPRNATVSPRAVTTGVARVSIPVTCTPAASRWRTVLRRPMSPSSRAWLLATLPITCALLRRHPPHAPPPRRPAMRKAKQAVEPGAHLRRLMGPSPMARLHVQQHHVRVRQQRPQRRQQRVRRSGSAGTRRPSRARAVCTQVVSRLVPSVTSPPAQTRTPAAVSARTGRGARTQRVARLRVQPSAGRATASAASSTQRDRSAAKGAAEERERGWGCHGRVPQGERGPAPACAGAAPQR